MRFKLAANCFLSAPTTYWFFSKASSNFSNWFGLNAVLILFGLRYGWKSRWDPGNIPPIIVYNRQEWEDMLQIDKFSKERNHSKRGFAFQLFWSLFLLDIFFNRKQLGWRSSARDHFRDELLWFLVTRNLGPHRVLLSPVLHSLLAVISPSAHYDHQLFRSYLG